MTCRSTTFNACASATARAACSTTKKRPNKRAGARFWRLHRALAWAGALGLAQPGWAQASSGPPVALAVQLRQALIQLHGRPVPQHARLQAVAQQLLTEYQQGQAPTLVALRAAAQVQGITDAQLSVLVVQTEATDAPERASALAAALSPYVIDASTAQMGWAAAPADAAVHDVCVVLCYPLLQLQAVPTRLPVATPFALRGHVVASLPHMAVQAATAAVQFPDGSLHSYPVALQHGQLQLDLHSGTSPGTLWVEILLHGARGPQMASLFAVQVGPAAAQAPYPAAMAWPPACAPFAEDDLRGRIDAARACYQVPPLHADPRLTQVAQAHGHTMRRRGHVAHGFFARDNVVRRLAAAHVVPQQVFENIALAESPSAAFAQWMASPAHAAAILSGAVDTVGLSEVPSWRHGGERLYTLILARLPVAAAPPPAANSL